MSVAVGDGALDGFQRCGSSGLARGAGFGSGRCGGGARGVSLGTRLGRVGSRRARSCARGGRDFG
jgi:hypothetical protein